MKIYDAYTDFKTWVENQNIFNWYSVANLDKLYTKTNFNYDN